MGQCVVGITRPRRPQRRLPREVCSDAIPGEDIVEVEVRIGRREPGAMGQCVADSYVRLSRRRELGPIARDGGAVVEPAFGDEARRENGHQPLGAREDDGWRVRAPYPLGAGIGGAAPEADHLRSADPDAERSAHCRPALKCRDEGISDAFEPGRSAATNHGHRLVSWSSESAPLTGSATTGIGPLMPPRKTPSMVRMSNAMSPQRPSRSCTSRPA